MSAHTLHWGIKASLLAYLDDVEAEILVVPPAQREVIGFSFPPLFEQVQLGEPRLLQFDGAVRAKAHGGLLDIEIATPRLMLGDAAGALQVWRGQEWITIATLKMKLSDRPSAEHWEATLTSKGAGIFGGNYPGGTVLAPVYLEGHQ